MLLLLLLLLLLFFFRGSRPSASAAPSTSSPRRVSTPPHRHGPVLPLNPFKLGRWRSCAQRRSHWLGAGCAVRASGYVSPDLVGVADVQAVPSVPRAVCHTLPLISLALRMTMTAASPSGEEILGSVVEWGRGQVKELPGRSRKNTCAVVSENFEAGYYSLDYISC